MSESAKDNRAREAIENLTRQLADMRDERDNLAWRAESQSIEIEKLREKLSGWRRQYRREARERARRDARMKAEALRIRRQVDGDDS